MKRAIIALGCLLVFSSGWAFGQTSPWKLDGVYWNRLGNGEVIRREKSISLDMYIVGFARGFLDGRACGGVDACAQVSPTSSSASSDIKVGSWFLQRDLPLVAALEKKPAVAPSDILPEMNLFYSDYRNAPVCWADAIAFSVESLKGNPPTEKEVNAARIAGAKSRSCATE